MKEFRLGKDDVNHYSSLEELRAAFKLKPITKRTTDEKKLAEQRKKFLKTCPYCNKKLSYICGNIIVCKNDNCNGKKIEFKNEDGTTFMKHYNYYKLLDNKGEEIANNILGE